ncbi:hypothetical protein FZEAL_2922 [Fusarium zealandicum]|uniref:N-acetyltransferase domain-containing protein n=1 Tax=Fusarium zealandicum TaxID=1053134 RepID=A0A8H4UQJ4_9HYPO|nr:hypothetical protein FZEAL_2922 [Fusarium zealandicum]
MEPAPIEWVTVKTTLPKQPLPSNNQRQPWRTERLMMRPMRENDLGALNTLRSQAEVMMWSVQGRPDENIDETKTSLALRLPPQDIERYDWGICLAETGDMIGLGGIGMMKGDQGWPVAGYMFLKEHWGRGYATEFLKGFLPVWWALPREEVILEVDKNTVFGDGEVQDECVSAITVGDNKASQNVMRKSGLELASVFDEADLRGETEVVTLYAFVAHSYFHNKTIPSIPHFTMQLPLPSLLATATGITGSAWASGAIAGLSLVGIPAALSAPSDSAIVWASIYNHGVSIMPRLAGTTAIAYLYAAYDAYRHDRSWKGFVAGALLTVAIVPYTVVFMSGTNDLLHAAAQGTLGASQNEVAKLIGRWGALNLARSLFPLIGTVAGFLGLFQTV